MRVLWLETVVPSRYIDQETVGGGWQDSLERIVRTCPFIELCILFVTSRYIEKKEIDGVTYIPIPFQRSVKDKFFKKYWDSYAEAVMRAVPVITQFNPDIIQVFGTEWPLAQIARKVKVPVVIHLMGSVLPYNNALYPPGYSQSDLIRQYILNPIKLMKLWKNEINNRNWEKWERETWSLISNYMGRTFWDRSLSELMHPGRTYYHVDEALRKSFISGNQKWKGVNNDKLRLVTIGCSTFWKGPDMLMKTAKILKQSGVDFEWKVIGDMPQWLREIVERKEKMTFDSCCVKIQGRMLAESVANVLCSSTLYVHTAYIENSPNSICEAQCVGIPIVATNVGGISSLVRHGVDGVLVPANDPYQMAAAIIELSNNKDRMKEMSQSSLTYSLQRNSDENIRKQVLAAYQEIVKRVSGNE